MTWNSTLTRRTELRADPEKTRAWQDRSRQELPKRGPKYQENREKNFGDRGPKVRAMRCLVCGRTPCDPHHEPTRKQGGDKHCLTPLCPDHHTLAPDSRHRLGSAKRFKEVHGIDLLAEAKRIDRELTAA